MSHQVVFLVDVQPPTDGDESPDIGPILYCDECRRWGAPGTTHLCGTNWFEHVTDLLNRMTEMGV